MKQPQKLLLIEDEEDICLLLKLHAEVAGFSIQIQSNGAKALNQALKTKPDLILLDIMLPGKNGYDVCKELKAHKETKHIPIIIITAKKEEIDEVLGLELGADDYVSKPFSPKVLLSRVNSVLRRVQKTKKPKGPPSKVTFGDFVFEIDRYILRKNEKTIQLTLSEFNILKRLATNRGKVLTREQLLDEIHNEEALVVDRNIDVHVASLRKKLGPNFSWIDTVRGVGYRLKEF